MSKPHKNKTLGDPERMLRDGAHWVARLFGKRRRVKRNYIPPEDE